MKRIPRAVLISIVTLGFALVIIFGFSSHPRYQNITKFEYLYKSVLYSVNNQLALVLGEDENEFNLDVPFYRQEHSVTCELAALRSSLSYKGLTLSEDDLISLISFDSRKPMTRYGYWGNPNKGFVGDVDGSIFKRTGYGVYGQPIEDLAKKFGSAEVIENANLSMLIEQVKTGNPVIAWGLLNNRESIFWKTNDGQTVIGFPGEHARVVTGYVGEEASPKKIILMDPIYGQIRMSTDKFLSDWKLLNNMAVVIKHVP